MNKKLSYQISKPSKKKGELEVIFLLHGYGSNDDDLFSLKEYINLKEIKVTVGKKKIGILKII